MQCAPTFVSQRLSNVLQTPNSFQYLAQDDDNHSGDSYIVFQSILPQSYSGISVLSLTAWTMIFVSVDHLLCVSKW
jgi:hypothetical protein